MSRPAAAFGALTVVGAGAAAYGTLIERNLFTLRRFDVPVLAPGSSPLRILHVSDLHITAGQARKQRYVAALAGLQPDLVVNTGDTISDPKAVRSVLNCLRPLADFPAVFVPGNNDYYEPRPSTPARYFRGTIPRPRGAQMPWTEVAGGLAGQGWIELTNARTVLTCAGRRVALGGVDDPHLERDRYELISGPADPTADVRLAVLHSPEPRLLERYSADGYDLALAGHTHGGQVRVPFGPAIVTNCGIDVHRARWLNRFDDRLWLHVCAGLGTNPYMPVRFACRPEASLLTLVGRDRPAGRVRRARVDRPHSRRGRRLSTAQSS
ncbi:MAG: metallophosphoesterase [bacterium]